MNETNNIWPSDDMELQKDTHSARIQTISHYIRLDQIMLFERWRRRTTTTEYNNTSVEISPRECCIFSTTGNTSSNDMISFPPSPIFASRAAKSASSFSNIEVMAGVSCDGSMIENLGRSVHSRRGLVDVVGGGVAAAASAVDDMARAVVVVVADAAAAVEGQEAT